MRILTYLIKIVIISVFVVVDIVLQIVVGNLPVSITVRILPSIFDELDRTRPEQEIATTTEECCALRY